MPRSHKWEIFWVPEESIKSYKNMKQGKLRPVLVFSSLNNFVKDWLIIECSTHSRDDDSIKINEYTNSNGEKVETWVLPNKIHILGFQFFDINKKLKANNEIVVVKEEYKNIIEEKLLNILSPEKLKELSKVKNLEQENQNLKELNQAVAKKVVIERKTNEKLIDEFCNIKNQDELLKFQEQLKKQLLEKKQEEEKQNDKESEQEL